MDLTIRKKPIDIQFIYRNFFPGSASQVIKAKEKSISKQDQYSLSEDHAAVAICSWFLSDVLPLFHTEADLRLRDNFRKVVLKHLLKREDSFFDSLVSYEELQSLLTRDELLIISAAVPEMFLRMMHWDDYYPFFEFPEDFIEPDEYVGKWTEGDSEEEV